jgi:hypothetical protein
MTFKLRLHTAAGQTALIAILILGFLTLGFIVIGLTSVVSETQIGSVLQNKGLAITAANACIDHAMDSLGRDNSYAGNESLQVASSTCTIRPIIMATSTWTIETYSQVVDQYARYRTILSSLTPVTVSSTSEIASF